MRRNSPAFTALVLALLSAPGCRAAAPEARISGELKLWHKLTLSFTGPDTSEDAALNPFLRYRLSVLFTHRASGKRRRVPGFFAADGDAANSSAKAGEVWQVRFTPDETGEWTYRASFREGENAALSTAPDFGRPAAGDGASGRFIIAESGKAAPDFRARGILRYVGKHHLRFAGDGSWFLKGGADSPENFLAYFEFDDTFDTAVHGWLERDSAEFIHRYEPHARDWREGDPSWRNGKGKNILGALNYLASQGANSVYFLTYNLDGGDGKDVWMWTSPESRDRFDVSKLAQWEIVFSHMTKLGLMLHVVTQERENDEVLGGGPGLNDVRKLYLRELVARFAHHPALVWNLGEENDTPDEDRKQIAAYIRALDPYLHPITVHSDNNRALTETYNNLLGEANFEATSIQGRMENYNNDAITMRRRSREAGAPWVVFGDEQPPARAGVLPDAEDPAHDAPRKLALWGNLMGGGGGVEWYFGYEYAHSDLSCEDWRSREKMWQQTRYALEFFERHLPFWEMEPANELASAKGALVLARAPDLYAVYLPQGGTTRLKLPAGRYAVQWYNPRRGGALARGGIKSVTGGGAPSLGRPPEDGGADWAALLKRETE